MSEANYSRVFLGLGGNLDDPLSSFVKARKKLAGHPGVRVVNSSPLYRTPAVGGPGGQPDYLNAVLEIATDLTAHQTLELCQRIEDDLGRTRAIRWEARTLDIDLLFFAHLQVRDKVLELPHPRLHLRHFTLVPLCDLIPDFVHPVYQTSLSRLLQQLPAEPGITRMTDQW